MSKKSKIRLVVLLLAVLVIASQVGQIIYDHEENGERGSGYYLRSHRLCYRENPDRDPLHIEFHWECVAYLAVWTYGNEFGADHGITFNGRVWRLNWDFVFWIDVGEDISEE